MSTRILIADGHIIPRTGLCALLERTADCQITGEAADGKQAVALAGETAPDIVIMDVNMPVLNGIEATRQILAANPRTHVILLSAQSNANLMRRSFQAGAVGYLLKDAAFEEIQQAIEATQKGEVYVGSACLARERKSPSMRPLLRWSLVAILLLILAIDMASRFDLIQLRGHWMHQAQAKILFSSIKPGIDGPTNIIGFEDYITDQCTIIKSDREITLALQEEPWKETGKGMSPHVVAEFSSKLIVESAGGLITVTCLDEDKNVAKAGVKSVISAFKKLYVEADPSHTKDVLNVLDLERNNIQNNISALMDLRNHVLGEGSIFTPESLERYYNNRLDECLKAESQLMDVQMELDVLRTKLRNNGVSIPANLTTDDPPVAEPQTIPAANQVPAPTTPIAPPLGASKASLDPRLVELESQVANYRQLLLMKVSAEMATQDLAGKVTQLHKIQEQEDDFKRRLAVVSEKSDALNNQLQLAKRADFLSVGDDAGQVLVEFENDKWVKLGPVRP